MVLDDFVMERAGRDNGSRNDGGGSAAFDPAAESDQWPAFR